MSTVVLIRPGATDFDEQNRIQGSLELPLSERGQDQVSRLIGQLRHVPVEVIYTAPCDPARATAEAVGAALGVRVRESEDLCNLDQGLWEGLQVEDVRHKYPRAFKQWLEAPETICPPEGETVPEALERVQRALRKPLRRKESFGIVASEPLASLISCHLRNIRPDLGEPGSRMEEGRLVEILQTGVPVNGAAELKAGVRGDVATNGSGASNGEHRVSLGPPESKASRPDTPAHQFPWNSEPLPL